MPWTVRMSPIFREYVVCRSLILPSNLLVGTLPASLSTLSRLDALDLSGNALMGSIPWQLGYLTGLR